MPKQVVSSLKFVSNACRRNYWQFFQEFWPLISAERLRYNWHIEKFCKDLQTISERVFDDLPKEYDLIWNCPPGTSKSSVCSVLWQPWIWSRMPSARFISGSYAERLALDLSRKSRDVIMSEKYTELFPEVKLREDQNTKGYFTNTAGGMRYAVGVGGSVIGMHAHFIAIDDPIDPQGVLSDLIINESNTWMSETLSQRKVDKLISVTALVQQRLHQNDATGHWLDRGGKLLHRCIPGDLEPDENGEMGVIPKEWQSLYIEGLLDPVRLPRETLEEAYKTLGEVGYAGQYRQKPVPRSGALFKVDRLQYSIQCPDKWKYGPVRFWDKAGTSGGGAYTCGVKGGVDFSDRVWILDVVRGQWDSGERERVILATARGDGKKVRVGMEQEPAAGGKESAENSQVRLARQGFVSFAIPASGAKKDRAENFSVEVNCGNVTLVPAPWNYEYVKEMRFFPNSRYKDQIDASSGLYTRLCKTRRRIGALG